MIKQTEIDIINKELGEIPDVLYHGRYAYPITKDEMAKELNIFESLSEIENMSNEELKQYGRTHLDCAFHGFYLTPCLGQALYWALTKPPRKDKVYQIVKVKKVKNLTDLKVKINVVPDLEWVGHIAQNRGKFIHYNPYDIVYNYIADGTMTQITNKIEGKKDYDKTELHRNLLDSQKEFLSIYYDSSEYSARNVIECLKLNEYRHYQLCISSNKALQCFKIDDIIELPNNYILSNGLNSKGSIISYIRSNFGYNVINEDIINRIK